MGVFLGRLASGPESGEEIKTVDSTVWAVGATMLWRETRTVKVKMLVQEDMFQVCFALLFTCYFGGSVFLAVASIGVPIMRIVMAFPLHYILSPMVAPTLVREAISANAKRELLVKEIA